ncbi:MAG TPA: EAL domain-containing protein [Solirubrobacteraceae bacterium]|nr:EAL domain-containing protein [Solirubrobacteraceae bacterium]
MAVQDLAARLDRRRPAAWQLYLVGGATLTGLYALVPPFKGSAPVINLLGFSGLVAMALGIRRNRPQARLAWWLCVFGVFLFFLGDVYTYLLPQEFGVNVPFPSPGDAIYLTMYPVLMAGLLLLVRRRNPGGDRAGVIDSLIMTLGLALISWVVLISPYVRDHTLSFLPKAVSVAYPMGDIILLAAAIRLAVDTGKRQPAFYLLLLSSVAMLITDFAYGVLTLQNAFTHQLILDVGWISFYLFWGAAALHPTMRALEHPGPDREPRLTPLRLILLTGATLIAPVLELDNVVRHNSLDLITTIAVSALLFALVVARMAGLVRQRERYIARDRTLAAAAADILVATSVEEICEAALRAVPSLVGGDVAARLCFVGDQEVHVAGVDLEPGQGTARWSTPGEALAELLLGHDSYAGVDASLSDEARAALQLPANVAEAFVVELPPRGDQTSRGFLVATGEAAASRAARSSLVALVTQASLALESNTLTAELHRRAGEARFRSLVQHAHDLITVLDDDATVIYQSPSIERALGYAPEEVLGTRFDQLLVPGENNRVLHLLADGRTYAGSDSEVIECSLRHRDGSTRHFEILHTNLLDDEAVGGIVLNGRDISERKAFEEQLERQAFHDPVTNLANRALFNERVRHALVRARREHANVAVVFLDLDDFKTINDSLGHAAGDEVLLEVGKRLATSIRAADTAARFGGDEFAILLEETAGPEEAADIAERIVESLKKPLHLDGKEILVQASLGIAMIDHASAPDADELIRNADAAMYIAKRDGKGSYRLFEPEMHAEVLARLELRADLQRALVNDEFELHYQPVIRLSDATIKGVEALVRWRHPERGLLAPNDFIPFAEATGLIVPIGRWVLREGCRQATAMQREVPIDPPLTMSINISVNQLHNSDIVADVRDALADSGLDPKSLTLEITETVMMSNADLAEQRLRELKQLGVQIALDDFGTGYSSLGYLARFPVDVIKMDRSFLVEGSLPVSSGLATAVIGLGKTFELDVVAEGIEFPEQWSTLRDLGCELGQGFYFAKPMEAGAAVAYLREHPEPDSTAQDAERDPNWVDAT